MISLPFALYAFLHSGTDLEAALNSLLEQIEVETVNPFDNNKNGKFHIAGIFL